MNLYPSTSKSSLDPLKSYTEISHGPVEPTLKITGGPVQLKNQNNGWSRCKFPGPVFPYILTGPLANLIHFTEIDL